MKRLFLIGILWLVGEYRLVAQGTEIRGTSAPFAVDIRRSQPRLPARTDYALIIANSQYDDSRYRALPNCVFDAEVLEKLLNEKFTFRTDLLRRATDKEFRAKLEEYGNRTWNENDQLLIYIAGHGGFDNVTKEGFLVMRNANKAEQTHTFSLLSLQRMLKNMPCKHVLLVLDVCYGGTFDDSIALEGEVLRGDPVSTAPPATTDNRRGEYVLKKLKSRTRIYVASGGKEPVVEGRPGEHSPFARTLLKKLTQTATGSGKLLTVYELTTALEQEVPTVRIGTFEGNQSNSDFLFIAK